MGSFQEIDGRALEMRFSEIHGKLDKMEGTPKITVEEHGVKLAEDRINGQLSKLRMDINEDVKEVKAELNAGKDMLLDSILWRYGSSSELVFLGHLEGGSGHLAVPFS